jgi:hypothetical protein
MARGLMIDDPNEVRTLIPNTSMPDLEARKRYELPPAWLTARDRACPIKAMQSDLV